MYYLKSKSSEINGNFNEIYEKVKDSLPHLKVLLNLIVIIKC